MSSTYNYRFPEQRRCYGKSLPLERNDVPSDLQFKQPNRKRNIGCEIKSSSKKVRNHDSRDVCLDLEELEELDNNGIPDIAGTKDIRILVNEFHDDVHQAIVVCSICDQFCPILATTTIPVTEFNSDMVRPLLAPDGISSVPLLPFQLVQQYDISKLPKIPKLFQNVLLSPRGVVEHQRECTNQVEDFGCSCVPHLAICEKWGCLGSFKRRSLPKFAIANGNYIGQLPFECRELTYGTACVLRPIQSYGRIVEFRGSGNVVYGSRLTGHMYSTKLDTPLVRSKLPIPVKDLPIRVLVVSPFAKNETVARKIKLAMMEEDYLIDPEKVRGVLKFWRTVNNPVMSSTEVDEEGLELLTSGVVSSEILIESEQLEEELPLLNKAPCFQLNN